MSTIASQITSLTIVYSTVYSGLDQRKHQSSASLAFVRGIHRWPVNSPHKGPVRRKKFPFDDIIMYFVFMNSYETQMEKVSLHNARMTHTIVLLATVTPDVLARSVINRVLYNIKLLWNWLFMIHATHQDMDVFTCLLSKQYISVLLSLSLSLFKYMYVCVCVRVYTGNFDIIWKL